MAVDLDWIDQQVRRLLADRWVGPPLKKSLPRVPQLDALPAAREEFEGRIVYIPYSPVGPTKGRFYACRLAADGATWEWATLDN